MPARSAPRAVDCARSSRQRPSSRSTRMAQALERPHHSSAFRARRTQNWLVMGFTYASMYMARYNFGFANKSLSDAYGWNKAQVGAIISAATLVYGVAALFNGPL